MAECFLRLRGSISYRSCRGNVRFNSHAKGGFGAQDLTAPAVNPPTM
jgi:hypothetical protein